MKTRYKVVIGPVVLLLVLPVLVLGGWWMSRTPYGEARRWSDAPADTAGRLSIVSEDWPIAAEADEPVRLETVYTVGSPGIGEGGALRLSLGWLLPTEQRVYIPFSLTTSSLYFFDINLLRDVRASTDADVDLEVVEPDPGEHFGRVLDYIKYKRGRAPIPATT